MATEDPDPLREVHLFIAGRYLVTSTATRSRRSTSSARSWAAALLHSEQFLLYRVLDALVDSFFPILGDMDDEIDDLERRARHPTDDQLQRLFSLKRQLVAMRKVITPQRDLFASSVDRSPSCPVSSSTSATTSAISTTT